MNILNVVGIGPGKPGGMTEDARQALYTSDIIIGYKKYVELVRPYFPNKEYIDSDMLQEVDRCQKALLLAQAGKTVSLICSGDAGVYGMAGLVYEISKDYPDVEIVVVPGVTAALSGGALLGAPLGHDFAVISLSDLLTSWDKIEKRLTCAAEADFCICLYNPASHKRKDHLKKACSILLRTLNSDTVCAIVRNIGRSDESYRLMSLSELSDVQADMFTTVFIGNSTTRNIGGKMITPRGYRNV